MTSHDFNERGLRFMRAFFMARDRIELPTRGFSVRCSTN